MEKLKPIPPTPLSLGMIAMLYESRNDGDRKSAFLNGYSTALGHLLGINGIAERNEYLLKLEKAFDQIFEMERGKKADEGKPSGLEEMLQILNTLPSDANDLG